MIMTFFSCSTDWYVYLNKHKHFTLGFGKNNNVRTQFFARTLADSIQYTHKDNKKNKHGEDTRIIFI